MKFNIDKPYLLQCFKALVDFPSPSGYSLKLRPMLERYAAELGFSMTYDNKDTPYITIDGLCNTTNLLLAYVLDI